MSEDTGDQTINFLNTDVSLVGGAWCVVTMVDGRQHVVSRHATQDQADRAERELNASAGERRFQP